MSDNLPRGWKWAIDDRIRESQLSLVKRGAQSCLSTAAKTFGQLKRGYLLTIDSELQSRELGVYDTNAWAIRQSTGWMYDSELIVAEFVA